MALTFHFVFALALVYGTSYAFKGLEEYDVPVLAVEILAGIVFGSVLGLFGPGAPGYEFFVSLAAFGLLTIMFDAGLELNPSVIADDPRRVGTLAVLTFVLPFLGGVGLGRLLGLTLFASFLVGVTVSTTSLGLVYPLLEDFDLLDDERGQFILSVAVLNDILSVAALAYGITLVTASRPAVGVGLVTAALVFFFVLLPFVLSDYIGDRLRRDVFENPVKAGVLAMVAVAYLVEQAGIHAVLGAFFAGLLVAIVTDEGHQVERAMKPVTNLAAPVFFFYVGTKFSVESLAGASATLLGTVVLVGIGLKVVGSLLGGLLTDLDRETTGLLASAMPGRLSISVAAAEIGLSRGIISSSLYDAFLVLTVVSVFLSVLSFRYVVSGEPTGSTVTH